MSFTLPTNYANDTVLIVDDTYDNLLVTKKVIQHSLSDINVVTIQNSQKVMEFLKNSDVSVAIFDMQMPEINGIELCKIIKSNPDTAHIPVMLITSHNPTPTLKVQGLEAGADDFLMRPIDNIELVARVKVCLRIFHAEAELRNSTKVVQEEYSYFFQKMLSGFSVHEMIYDEEGKAIDYRFLRANPAFETHTGLVVKDIIGKTVKEVVPGIDQKWIDRFARVVKTGIPDKFTQISAALNKYYEVAAFSVGPKSFAVSFTDITERKKSTLEKNRLLSAIEQSAESILIANAAGEIEYCNSAFEKITGYKNSEVVGENPRFLQSGKHTKEFYKTIWDTLLSGNTWSGKLINRKKDGSIFTEEAIISPVRNESGEVINYVSSRRDTTRENQLEEQLRQSQKMEAVGRLAGGIAHDFNNILCAIIGYVELAKEHVSKGSELDEYISEIEVANSRAKDLVSQILSFSHLTTQDSTPVHIGVILKEALSLLREIIPSTITIRKNINMDCGLVLADATQIHQLIMNLATNAYHSMRDGHGTLTLSLSEVCVTKEELQKREIDQCRHVCIEVSDTGHGIDETTKAHIFDPYFTTKEVGDGTGLGLAIVHTIVQDHGGTIQVTSTINKGTTFKVFFPIIEESELQLKKPSPVCNVGSTILSKNIKREKILVVDDEAAITRTFGIFLRKRGYEVTALTSSVDALNAFTANPLSYDLMVSDLTMPQMTGVELSKKILKIRPGFPIILCTGFSEDAIRDDAIAGGVEDFIMKPVNPKDLLKSILTILDKKKGPEIKNSKTRNDPSN
jgi:PAS domain S-box-containing protein